MASDSNEVSGSPEPLPPRPAPDTTWIKMDVIEKAANQEGGEHREQ